MQQATSVKTMFAKNNTILINVLGRMTSHVKLLAVAINYTFKNRVWPASEEDLHKNLQVYTEENLTASNMRVMTTKCVGVAWAGMK